jgi:5-methylcytosine-specific restriction endonuclease McrBC regulatory subunit McrC
MAAFRLLQEARAIDEGIPPYDGVLSLSEHSSRSVELPRYPLASEVHAIVDFLRPAVRADLLKVSLRIGEFGKPILAFRTGSTVGFTSCTDISQASLFVRVQPKIAADKMLDLGMAAGMVPRWRQGNIQLGVSADSIMTEWTLRTFESTLQRFLTRGGLRSTHERVEAELSNKLRGRMNVRRFVRNIAKGRYDRIPSIYSSLQLDNIPNQLLLLTIRTAIKIASTLPSALDLVYKFRAAQRRFASVSSVPYSSTLRWPKHLPRPLAHYEEVLHLADLVLHQVNLVDVPGYLRSVAVAIDMNLVYQRAFFRGLRSIVPAARETEEWHVPLPFQDNDGDEDEVRHHTKFVPDIYLPPDNERMPVVLDTKWKDTLGGEELLRADSPAVFRPDTADLYQVMAYAMECLRRSGGTAVGVGRCVAVLLYPSIEEVRDFGTTFRMGNGEVKIRILGWNLNGEVQQSIADVWTRILKAASSRPPGGEARPTEGRLQEQEMSGH